MQTVLIVVHLMIVLAMVGLVLLQRSEGGGLGMGGGGGFMTTRGSTNMLTRTTAILAACFFVTSLVLSILAGHRPQADLDPWYRRARTALRARPVRRSVPAAAACSIGCASRPAASRAAGSAVAVTLHQGPGNRPFGFVVIGLCGLFTGGSKSLVELKVEE